MSNTIPGLEDLVELRESSYPELGKLWWPRYDQACWSYMHEFRVTPEFFLEVMSHVDSTGVMVQAGGNCGQYVRQFAQWFGTAYTFEPNPLNFMCLTLNCGNNVIKTQACIGNDKKFVNLNLTFKFITRQSKQSISLKFTQLVQPRSSLNSYTKKHFI